MLLQNQETYLKNYDLKIAYKTNKSNSDQALIAIHGWLDNANSFDQLAPYFGDEFKLYNIDLAGHGLSDHLKKGSDYLITTTIQQVLEFAETLGLNSFHLVGHSLGSALASLIAGVVPNRIKTLTLIEGLGPFSSPEEELPHRIYDNLRRKKKSLSSQKPIYNSKYEGALDRHKKTGLGIEQASILADRGLVKTDKGGFTWKTDTRLLLPSIHPLSEAQVRAFLKNIEAPTLLIMGNDGLKFPEEVFQARLNCLKRYSKLTFEGTHHIHMESPKPIAEAIKNYIKQSV